MTALFLAALVAAQQPPVRFTQISFVSGAQVYVAAGREDGVREGMELAVLRADTVTATLRVQFVSSHQAACTIVRGAQDVAPGERVRFTAAPDSVAPAPAPASPRAAAAPGRRSAGTGSAGLHGRFGTRYGLSQVEGAGSLSQPAFDVRANGARLGGTPLGLMADVRARSSRSSLTGPAAAGQVTDVYQLALLWNQPGAPFHVALGRQYLSAVSSIVLLDGALAELTRRHVGLGVFAGLEPAIGDTSQRSVVDAGAYMRLQARAWVFTLGGAGSYAAGQPNREFAFGQLTIQTSRLSLFGSQQVDYYRAAKVAAGERTISPTSSYLSAILRLNRAVSVDGGFDNRRNVRLYRDLVDPLSTFDDAYRRAAWGGAGYVGRHLRLRLEGRGSGGGSGGAATALTASGGLDRLARGLGVWGRVTRYRAGQLTGWLAALRTGVDLSPAVHAEANGGWRRDVDPPAALGTRTTTWYGAQTDVSIGRSWYGMLSLNRESGPDGVVNQVYASLSWRF